MADKIEQLFSTQKELTRAVAHDLRTPLYRLRFAVEMVKSESEVVENHEYFDAIDRSINDLDQLINQTLVLSRYNSAADVTSFDKCDLSVILEEEISYFKLDNPTLSIEFIIDLPLINDKPYVDKKALLRGLNNLLSNAARYAQTKILIHYYLDAGQYCLSVEEDGTGIPESQWEKVFSPFTQLNNEQRNNNNEGHGLGLAIVKQIMKWHSGNVELDQSSLGGAKFKMRWPKQFH
jgi:two-component system sensor histidine kinase RstB